MLRAPVAAAAILALSALAIVAPETTFAAAGEVTHLSGAVVAQRPDGRSQILSIKSQVQEGDVLATAENSFARVKFSDGTEAVLRPSTQVKIDAFKFEEQRPQQDNVVLSLLKGGMRAVTGFLARRNPANFRVATPSATIGIRGTNFGIQFCNNDCGGLSAPKGGAPANGLHADVADGAISITTQAGALVVGVGQFAFVQSPVVLPVLVPPAEGVRITLPPQATGPAQLGGTVGKTGGLECAVQ
ncbi:MAG: FecR domain-containing protein [Betaproteobacteria bacterium]|nr:FecR domain-containing protein [Betaproteobacteria bacterium]